MYACAKRTGGVTPARSPCTSPALHACGSAGSFHACCCYSCHKQVVLHAVVKGNAKPSEHDKHCINTQQHKPMLASRLVSGCETEQVCWRTGEQCHVQCRAAEQAQRQPQWQVLASRCMIQASHSKRRSKERHQSFQGFVMLRVEQLPTYELKCKLHTCAHRIIRRILSQYNLNRMRGGRCQRLQSFTACKSAPTQVLHKTHLSEPCPSTAHVCRGKPLYVDALPASA